MSWASRFLFICSFYSLFIKYRCEAPLYKTIFIMEKLGFIKYEAPEVELIEVEVEKGFAVTGGNDQWEEE